MAPDGPAIVMIPPYSTISIHQLRVWVCGSSSKAQRKCSKALWLRVGRDNSASASVSPDLPPVNRPKSVGHRWPFRCAGRDVFRIFPDVFFGGVWFCMIYTQRALMWDTVLLIVSIRQTLWQLPTWPTSYSIMHWMACPGSLTCRRTFRISLSSTGSWISSTLRCEITILYYTILSILIIISYSWLHLQSFAYKIIIYHKLTLLDYYILDKCSHLADLLTSFRLEAGSSISSWRKMMAAKAWGQMRKALLHPAEWRSLMKCDHTGTNRSASLRRSHQNMSILSLVCV